MKIIEQCWCEGKKKKLVVTTNPHTGQECLNTQLCGCAISTAVNEVNPVLAPTGGSYISEREHPFTVRRNLIITETSIIDFLLRAKHFAMSQESCLDPINIYHSIEVLTKFYLADGSSRLVDLFRKKLLIILFDCSQKNEQLSNVILEVVNGRSSMQIEKNRCLYPTWIFCPEPLDSCEWEFSSALGKIIKDKFYNITLADSGIVAENKVKAKAEVFSRNIKTEETKDENSTS